MPTPEQPVLPEDTIKATLPLSESSVKFFKRNAAKHRMKYQRIIRELVDKRVEQYSE